MTCLRTCTEGLPDRISVLELGGVVKGRYKDDDQVDVNQYLTGRAFLPRSAIPDIKPNAKTISICGIPLNKFKNRQLLPKAAGGRQEPPGGEYQFSPDERIFSYDVLLTEVKERGLTYMASYPGLDERAKNIALHGSINRLLEDDERPTLMELVEMRDSLDYRMSQIMGAATAYKKFWDLDMPDCEIADVDAYVGPNVRRAFALVGKYALFDEPASLQGHTYVKGLKYIACCIAEAGWSYAEATAKLDSLVKYYETDSSIDTLNNEAAVPTSGTPHIDGMSRLVSMINTKILKFEREIRQELKTISQRTKRRIRAMSPSKPDTPRRKGLPEEWVEDTTTANMAKLGLRGAGPSSLGPSHSGPSSPSSSNAGYGPSSPSSSRGGTGLSSPSPSRGGGRSGPGPTTPSHDGGGGSGRGRGGPGPSNLSPGSSRGGGFGRGGPGLSNPSPGPSRSGRGGPDQSGQ